MHDESMKQQSQSILLIDQIRKLHLDSAKLSQGLTDSLLHDLGNSSDAMMDWMAKYEIPKQKDSIAFKYFETQLVQMKKISNDLALAISNAKKIIPLSK